MLLHLLDHAWRPASPPACPEEARTHRRVDARGCNLEEVAHTLADEIVERIGAAAEPSSCTPCPAPVEGLETEFAFNWVSFWPWLGAALICQATTLIS